MANEIEYNTTDKIDQNEYNDSEGVFKRTVYLKESLHDQLKAKAKEKGMKLSPYIVSILMEAMDDKADPLEARVEAIEEFIESIKTAAKDRLVDHGFASPKKSSYKTKKKAAKTSRKTLRS